MFNKIKNILFLSSLLFFFILTVNIYLSDNNIRETNKNRSLYSVKSNNDLNNLPLLKNDTNDIIEYRNDIEVYKKKKKSYKFWDLIKK